MSFFILEFFFLIILLFCFLISTLHLTIRFSWYPGLLGFWGYQMSLTFLGLTFLYYCSLLDIETQSNDFLRILSDFIF